MKSDFIAHVAMFSRFVHCIIIATNVTNVNERERERDFSTYFVLYFEKYGNYQRREFCCRLHINSHLTVLSQVAHKFSPHVLSLVHINVISGVVIESRYKEITTIEINVTNGRRVLLRQRSVSLSH